MNHRSTVESAILSPLELYASKRRATSASVSDWISCSVCSVLTPNIIPRLKRGLECWWFGRGVTLAHGSVTVIGLPPQSARFNKTVFCLGDVQDTRTQLLTSLTWPTFPAMLVSLRLKSMAATVMTLNDLQGHSPVAGLFKCKPSNIYAAFYTN